MEKPRHFAAHEAWLGKIRLSRRGRHGGRHESQGRVQDPGMCFDGDGDGDGRRQEFVFGCGVIREANKLVVPAL